MFLRGVLFLILGVCSSAIYAQKLPEILLAAGEVSDLPKVVANTNKFAAGEFSNDRVEINLEIIESDFRPETDDRPGLKVWAFNQKGDLPMIPAPLIRVIEGTLISLTFTNNHPDSTINLFGLKTKGVQDSDVAIGIEPGETKNWDFEANKAGTYFYYAEIGKPNARMFSEKHQLGGAFIIDEVGVSNDDEIIVMNIFSQSFDSTYSVDYVEALTMNGKSWPFSQIFKSNVGNSLTWRIINVSNRNHPMHLHGFYYEVESIGTAFEDDIYEDSEVRTVVTEFMRRRTTMKMSWSPSREGKWLFHCHLSFHVSPEIRLPGSEEYDDHHVHMAGLVVGIDIDPGVSDLISHGDIRTMKLYINDYPDSDKYKYSFSLLENFQPDSTHNSTPGPLLVMKQYETTDVEVINNMNQSTGIHWHGLELDSWADGVPNFSASDGKMSPIIEPGQSFTYRLSHMRAGTFIYHSHLNDVDQITGGLYGPLIVLPKEEEYDSEYDHLYTFQWKNSDPQELHMLEVNGITVDKPQDFVVTKTGEEHRLRMINIAPAGAIRMFVKKDSMFVPIKAWAKDGADLPESQRVFVDRSMRIGAGETIDFIFKPEKSGTYELFVGYNEIASAKQTWIVKD